MNYNDIQDDLAFLDAPDDRLSYVIDLGKSLPKLAESEKNEFTKISGCASQVWLVPEFDDGELRFRGGSDAIMVSGIVAILLSMVNEASTDEILSMDIEENFQKLGLSNYFTPQRSNGLRAMAERIQELALLHKKGQRP